MNFATLALIQKFTPKKICHTALILIILLLVLSGCGAGSSSSDHPISYHGIVVSPEGKALSDVSVYIFETAESSNTDQNGEFLLESYKAFGSIGIFVQSAEFSNTIRINDIPESTKLIDVALSYDIKTRQLKLISENFDDQGPEVPAPQPEPEPQPKPTAVPGKTPTVRPGNFDNNGDTQAFGIPKGTTGNISRGRSVWSSTCSNCHAESEKTNKSYGTISSAVKRIPEMKNLGISVQQTADLAAYLNRGRK